MVHPSSVNGTTWDKSREVKTNFGTLFTYGSMSRSNDGGTLFLRDTTETTPLVATLFGGKLRRNEERGNIVEVDNWLPFYISSFDRRSAKTLIEFRKALERLLTITFKDLGKLSQNRQFGGGVDRSGRRSFLADEEVREMFASGLVDVLTRDVKVREATATRGWMRPSAHDKGLNRISNRDSTQRDNTKSVPSFYADMMKN